MTLRDLPENTELIGLRVVIPKRLRSKLNLLNKGYIRSTWAGNQANFTHRNLGVWLTKEKDGKQIFPAFFNNTEEFLQCEIIS